MKRPPAKWSEMSVDYRLMMGFHLSMMVLMIANGFAGGMTMERELQVVLGLIALMAGISIRHRRRSNWRWPGVDAKGVLWAIGSAIGVTFFLFAATPLFPPTSPNALPWYLAGANIGVFAILQSLNVVAGTNEEFEKQCVVRDEFGVEKPPQSAAVPLVEEPTEAAWKKRVRVVFTGVFMLVWIAGVSSFYLFGTAFKNGSPTPTATQTEPLEDHGKTVYVTPAEKRRITLLQTATMVGIPMVLLTGAILHFLVGVKIFGNAPSLADAFKKPELKSS